MHNASHRRRFIVLTAAVSSVFMNWMLAAAQSPASVDVHNAKVADVTTNLAKRNKAWSVDESLAAFQTSPEIKIELVACEPNVIDPVAARFDSSGRLWIVEMRDYPTGPLDGESFSGTIRVLRDNDSDGVYEHATVFADKLIFPTGLQPWRDGVIVTLAGRIAYMADTDGDDRCDVEETWFKGFAEDNTQLRANHPVLGIDGLVYVAGGLRGGTVESVDERWTAQQAPVRLLKTDFAFDPNGGFWGAVAGDSQYGLVVDDFGNRIGVSNRNPAKLAVLPLSLVAHDPWMAPASVIFDLSASGPDSSVQSIAEAWTTSNLHAGQYSAACAPHEIAATRLPKTWQGNLLCCEPTAYLVQRARVDATGMVPKSKAVFDPGEAIASRDTWFRPVDLIGGPDGSVYVVDMHRAVIEHPQWVPEELKNRVDERYGDTNGRIYRIHAAADSLASNPNKTFEMKSLESLVRGLDHPNRWQREEATRLLYEHGRESVASVRNEFSTLESPAALSRAASLLARFNALEIADLEKLATSEDELLRSVAARLAVTVTNGSSIAAQLAGDAAPSVQLAAVTSLASGEHALTENEIDSLAKAAATLNQHDAFVLAIGAVSDANLRPLLLAILNHASSQSTEIAKRLVRRDAASAPQQEPLWMTSSHPSKLEFAGAWVEGVTRSRNAPAKLVKKFSSETQASWDELLANALKVALDANEHPQSRVAAIRLASLGRANELMRLRDENASIETRIAAIEACASTDFSEHLNWLDRNVNDLPWSIALRSVNIALSKSAGQIWVLDSLASGKLARGLVPPAEASKLLASKDKTVSQKAESVLQAAGKDRALVIAKYRSEMPADADVNQGRQLFLKHCAACHVIANEGFHVGPDISDSRTQTPDSLLVSILDPSLAIDAGFVRYSVLTTDGRVMDGLLVDDRPDAVTLKISGGELITIQRDQIEELNARGVSLMPDGFEQLLPPQEMSNLISYLKNWRYLTASVQP